MLRRWIIRALPFLFLAAILLLSFVRADENEVLILGDAGGGAQRIVLPGETAFLPQRWLPAGPTLNRVSLHSRYLRSKQLYFLSQHEILGLDQSFAVQLTLNYRYRIDAPALSALLAQAETPDVEGIGALIKLRLDDFWFTAFRDRLGADDQLDTLERSAEQYIRSELVTDLNKTLSADGIVIESVLIEDIAVPDPARYRAVLANGQRLVDDRLRRLSQIEEARVKRAADEILLSGKRKHLAELGELLGRYPDLREYIAIDGLNDRVQVFVMPYDRFTGDKRSGSGLLPGGDTGLHRFDQGTDPSNGGFRDLTPP